MARIDTTLSPDSPAFAENRDGMTALLDALREIEGRARAASEAARPRFEKRHQLLPRDRVALLLDPGKPFVELSKLAGYGLDAAEQFCALIACAAELQRDPIGLNLFADGPGAHLPARSGSRSLWKRYAVARAGWCCSSPIILGGGPNATSRTCRPAWMTASSRWS